MNTRAPSSAKLGDYGKKIAPAKGDWAHGMAICKHLVELHGGSISAESAGPGRGAMIKIKFRTIASGSDPIAERLARRVLKKEELMPDSRLKDIKVVAVD